MEKMKAGKIIAAVNNKGGVGKTNAAVNLAAGLAGTDRRVLLVDLDAQGSASLSLGIARADLRPSAADVLLHGLPVQEAIRRSYVEGLDVLTGSMELSSADLALADLTGREVVLRAALAPIRREYDVMMLDCPPSLGLLTVNALTAADLFFVPVTPDYLSLEGLVNLMGAVELIRSGIGKTAALLGILLTMCDYRLNATAEIISMIRRHYGRQVFKTEIKSTVRLKEAPSFGKTIFDYDRGSAGAECYRELVREVLGVI